MSEEKGIHRTPRIDKKIIIIIMLRKVKKIKIREEKKKIK